MRYNLYQPEISSAYQLIPRFVEQFKVQFSQFSTAEIEDVLYSKFIDLCDVEKGMTWLSISGNERKHFLSRVFRNALLDYYKSAFKKRIVHFERVYDQHMANYQPSIPHEQRQLSKEIQQALNQVKSELSGRKLEIFHLLIERGFSNAVIAERMDIPMSHIGGLIRTIRKKIQHRIEENKWANIKAS